MDIGIVTCFYNYYDKFFCQWLNSILELKTKPSTITVIVAGKKYDIENLINGIKILKEINIPYNLIYIEEKTFEQTYGKNTGIGYYRNYAVRNTDTEWIMMLDVDDIILPNGIDDISKYKNGADIIACGYRVFGYAKKKFVNKFNAIDRGDYADRLYSDINKEKILKGTRCPSPHAVFKKKFWEMSPCIEYTDFMLYPFFAGLIQKGAEVVGMEEVCTAYLSREDGHNASLTPDDWKFVKKVKEITIKEGL
jgi:glycosyltransferase involved in cell wall biosynthesis